MNNKNVERIRYIANNRENEKVSVEEVRLVSYHLSDVLGHNIDIACLHKTDIAMKINAALGIELYRYNPERHKHVWIRSVHVRHPEEFLKILKIS